MAPATRPAYLRIRRVGALQSAHGTLVLDGKSHGGELVIRAAEEADLAAIHALECASFSTDLLSRRALRQFLRNPRRPLLTARSSGRVIGYILTLLRERSKAARIYSLAVDPAHARRGIGRELLHAAERYARAHGRTWLRLEVRYDRPEAIRLYEKLGYRAFGRYPGYYEDGAEALRYEKLLTVPQQQK